MKITALAWKETDGTTMSEPHLIRGGYQSHLSLLRIVATVSIVWLHTCSTLAKNPDVFIMSDRQHRFLSAGYQMMQWAVPVFFMITGALLLDPRKKISVHDCWKKYLARILLALVIFGIPFAMLRLVMETGDISVRLIPLSIKAVLENQSLSHLWYLYTLIGIYLALPVLRSFAKRAYKAELQTVFIALIIIDFVVPTVNAVTGLKIAFNMPLSYPLFYLLAGYYLNKLETKRYEKMAGICVAVILAGIWILNYKFADAADLTHYNSPLIAALAVAVFIASKRLKVSDEQRERIWKIDRMCFGVYLIHPVFIQFFYRFLKITPMKAGAGYALAGLGLWVAFTFAAFAGSYVLGLIKPLKKYVL